MSGLSCERMSAKSPSLFTLSGANSAMSTGPDHSSLCLMSSHDVLPPLSPSGEPEGPPLRGEDPHPRRRTSTHDPFSLKPSRVNFRSPFLSAASTSSVSAVHVPLPHSITIPAPKPDGMTPSNSPYSIG